MTNKKAYTPPFINIQTFDIEPNVSNSGNSEHQDGDPKNGNAGNNQQCWAKAIYEGFIYDAGAQTYICMPGSDMTYPAGF